MKPLLSLIKIRENVFGYKNVDVLAFNYDGTGKALVAMYNRPERIEISVISNTDLDYILFENAYKVVSENKFRISLN